MKTFKDYLTESKKQWPFRVKIAGAISSDQEKTLKGLLERFTVSEFRKLKTTPVQALPLDFPQVKNCEVNIFEVVLDYPATPQELVEYLSTNLGVNKKNLVVRNPNEPGEEYQNIEKSHDKKPLLTDPTYAEAGNPKFEDYYGDKYNSGFVKELNDLLKLERKARGEQIPTEGAAKYNVDSPANDKSPVQQAKDPRK
jgi:hypothetical protein